MSDPVPLAAIIRGASWMRDDTDEMDADELETLREESAADDDDRLPVPPGMPGLEDE